jgi:four helix bundle protein
MFGHEKLDVYRLELEFLTWLTDPTAELTDAPVATHEIRSQLDRASLSTLLNTAEGNGKRERQLRVRYFDDARGSAAECAACLDALVARRVTTRERVDPGKSLLVRIAQMLTKLVANYSGAGAVREEEAWYDEGLGG